jgi:hypothetical protein
MSNIRGLITPECILGDIGRKIPASLQGSGDKDKIQLTGHEFRVSGSPGYELFAQVVRQSVQSLVAQFERPG